MMHQVSVTSAPGSSSSLKGALLPGPSPPTNEGKCLPSTKGTLLPHPSPPTNEGKCLPSTTATQNTRHNQQTTETPTTNGCKVKQQSTKSARAKSAKNTKSIIFRPSIVTAKMAKSAVDVTGRDGRNCLTCRLPTSDRSKGGQGYQNSLSNSLVSVTGNLATTGNVSGGGCGNRSNMRSNLAIVTNKLVTGREATSGKGGGQTTLNSLTSTADEIATLDRPTTGGGDQCGLTSNLAVATHVSTAADGVTKGGSNEPCKTKKLAPTTDQLAAAGKVTEGLNHVHSLTVSFQEINLEDGKFSQSEPNEICSLTITRKNGETACVRWHKNIPHKSHAIFCGKVYPPDDNYQDSSSGQSCSTGLQRNTLPQFRNYNTKARTCNCGRNPSNVRVPISSKPSNFQQSVSHYWRSPLVMPFEYWYGSPSLPYMWANSYIESESPLILPSKTFWFHGTDLKHARNIISNGIDLEQGRFRRQFSNGYGFYLSDNFEHARWWACRNKSGQPSVIIFKLSLIFNNYVGLNLAQDERDWQDILECSLNDHNQYPLVINPLLYFRYTMCDYVYGPVLKNRPFNQNLQSWKPLGFQSPCRQLCVRNINLARVISQVEHIDSVITFTGGHKQPSGIKQL